MEHGSPGTDSMEAKQCGPSSLPSMGLRVVVLAGLDVELNCNLLVVVVELNCNLLVVVVGLNFNLPGNVCRIKISCACA